MLLFLLFSKSAVDNVHLILFVDLCAGVELAMIADDVVAECACSLFVDTRLGTILAIPLVATFMRRMKTELSIRTRFISVRIHVQAKEGLTRRPCSVS